MGTTHYIIIKRKTMDITPAFLALVPIVVGLVEIVKGVGLPARFAGLASLLLGIGGAFLIGGAISEVVLGGLVVGLTASGLYSAGRSTLKI